LGLGSSDELALTARSADEFGDRVEAIHLMRKAKALSRQAKRPGCNAGPFLDLRVIPWR
jgi:hypothetical protein